MQKRHFMLKGFSKSKRKELHISEGFGEWTTAQGTSSSKTNCFRRFGAITYLIHTINPHHYSKWSLLLSISARALSQDKFMCSAAVAMKRLEAAAAARDLEESKERCIWGVCCHYHHNIPIPRFKNDWLHAGMSTKQSLLHAHLSMKSSTSGFNAAHEEHNTGLEGYTGKQQTWDLIR